MRLSHPVVAVLAQSGRGIGWATYLLAAALVGLLGALLADLQSSSASLYLGVAILPLVPGFTLYRSMLALAEGDTPTTVAGLQSAALISMAIAVGVAVGVAVGRNILRTRRALAPGLPSHRRDRG